MSLTIVKCAQCGSEQFPAMPLNNAGVLAPSCPSCGQEHPGLTLDDFTATHNAASAPPPAMHPPALPSVARAPAPPAVPSVARPPWAAPQAHHAPAHHAAPAPRVDHVSVLDGLRARLCEIDGEVARLEGLKSEAKQLRSMLAAADRVPRIRSNGHAPHENHKQ